MKKIITMLCAFALALALPASAFAAGSAEDDSYRVNENVFYSSGTYSFSEGAAWGDNVTITDAYATDDVAANVTSDMNVLKSWVIEGTVDGGVAELYLSIGKEWAGKTITMFIQHATWNEQKVLTVDESGHVQFTVTEFSTFTAVEGAYYGTAPKTGVDNTTVALGATGALAIAGAAAVALRRKVTE